METKPSENQETEASQNADQNAIGSQNLALELTVFLGLEENDNSLQYSDHEAADLQQRLQEEVVSQNIDSEDRVSLNTNQERVPTQNTEPEATASISEHCHKERTVFEKRTKSSVRKLWIASALCVCFMITEIIGGVLSNSLAIATDASHLLTDLSAFMISIFAIWLGSRQATQKFPFGWHRAEIIGALVSVLTIWLLTGILVYLAVLRLLEMDFVIEAKIMLIASGIGIVFNIIMASVLHQSSITHEHSHSSSIERIEGNINVRAALIHVIGDLILSLGIFIAALIIYFEEGLKIVDPLCTLFFSILVLLTTYKIMKDILIVLMEGAPRGTNMDRVIQRLTEIEGVIAIHNIRIWALSLEKRALSAHVVIDPEYQANDILNAANNIINTRFNFFEHTIQVEPFTARMKNCIQCETFPKRK